MDRTEIKLKIEGFLNQIGFIEHHRLAIGQTEREIWSNQELAEAMSKYLFLQILPDEQ